MLFLAVFAVLGFACLCEMNLQSTKDLPHIMNRTVNNKDVSVIRHDSASGNKKLKSEDLDPSLEEFAPVFKTKLYPTKSRPAGSSSKLKCPSEGNPYPNITWYRDGVTPPQRALGSVSQVRWGIFMDDITPQDGGNYTCIVCNGHGCISHSYILIVQERYPSKPYIKDGYPGNHTVLQNDTVRIECPILSDLHVHISWYKVANLTAYDETLPGTSVQSDDYNDPPERLTLVNVTREDEGLYICQAVNYLGNATAKVYLTVLDQNPAIPQERNILSEISSLKEEITSLKASLELKSGRVDSLEQRVLLLEKRGKEHSDEIHNLR